MQSWQIFRRQVPFLKGTAKDYITFLLICQDKRRKGESLMKKQLKVIELFAGIGAPRKALIRGGTTLK